MANNKTGFDYYNLDTNRYQDIKIKRLKKDFKTAGIAVYDYILCEIYRVKGCFLVWDESTAFDVAEYFGLKESLVNEIVNYCAAVGLFDKELLRCGSKNLNESNCGDACGNSQVRTCGGIITSRSIQQRFMEMSLRAKRKDFKIPDRINILTEELKIIPEQSHIIPEVSDKVKESKGKEYIPPIIPQGGMSEFENSLIQRKKELEDKETELLAKEQELLKREAALKTQSANKLPDISFVNDDFKAVFSSWLEYKRERKESYRSKKSLEACYKKLLELSNNNPDTARLIIEQSMASNWAGIFELKNGSTGKATFGRTATDSTGKVVCGKTETGTDIQSCGTAQKDYSSRF